MRPSVVYKTYMRSDEWRMKRAEFILYIKHRNEYFCAKCRRPPNRIYNEGDRATVHHLTYKNLGNEQMEDLQYLCSVCHRRLHKKKDQNRKKSRQASLNSFKDNRERMKAKRKRAN